MYGRFENICHSITCLIANALQTFMAEWQIFRKTFCNNIPIHTTAAIQVRFRPQILDKKARNLTSGFSEGEEMPFPT